MPSGHDRPFQGASYGVSIALQAEYAMAYDGVTAPYIRLTHAYGFAMFDGFTAAELRPYNSSAPYMQL